jgi:hypothetical protein
MPSQNKMILLTKELWGVELASGFVVTPLLLAGAISTSTAGFASLAASLNRIDLAAGKLSLGFWNKASASSSCPEAAILQVGQGLRIEVVAFWLIRTVVSHGKCVGVGV